MNKTLTLFTLALLSVTTAKGEGLDSLDLFVQRGDSLMQQYNTYEALKYYQQAYDKAQQRDAVYFSMNDSDPTSPTSKSYVPEDRVPRQLRLKLADCQKDHGEDHGDRLFEVNSTNSFKNLSP